MKSKGTAYLLWLISFFGWLGFHHFYLGKIGKGIIWIITGGVFGIGSLIDLFTLGGQVESYNTKRELDTIRASSLANITSKRKSEQSQNISNDSNISAKQYSSTISDKTEQGNAIQNKERQSKRYSTNPKPKYLKIGLPVATIAIIISIVIYSNSKPDFSDPKLVIESIENLWRVGDLDTYYEYLSEESKSTYASFDDFKEKRKIPDSTLNNMSNISLSVKEIMLSEFPNYRCFEIHAVDKTENEIDTNTYYRTTVNENGNWKLVWNKEIVKNGSQEFNNGEFIKASELFNDAVELDPYSIPARTQLVWSYLRSSEKPTYWQDTSAYHLNIALKIDSTDGEIYNTIGAYYGTLNKNTEAVENFLLAAKYYQNESAKANAYSNAAQNAKGYDISVAKEYLRESLDLNEESRFVWQTLGDLHYESEEFRQANEKYKKAIELVSVNGNTDNHTLISLYGQYALTCKKLGLRKEAEEYILKCIRVYPDQKHPIFEKLNL